MLTTIQEATLFMQGKLGQAAPRSRQLALQDRFIGVGQIIWLGISRDTEASFARPSITLRRGVGVVGDRRSGHSRRPGYTDPLADLLLPGITTANTEQVTLVSQEDADVLELHDSYPYPAVIGGAQSENIRTTGLKLERVPFGGTIWMFSPEGEVSPATLLVIGSYRNCLKLAVHSANPRGNAIGLHWFVAAFMPIHQ